MTTTSDRDTRSSDEAINAELYLSENVRRLSVLYDAMRDRLSMKEQNELWSIVGNLSKLSVGRWTTEVVAETRVTVLACDGCGIIHNGLLRCCPEKRMVDAQTLIHSLWPRVYGRFPPPVAERTTTRSLKPAEIGEMEVGFTTWRGLPDIGHEPYGAFIAGYMLGRMSELPQPEIKP